MRKVERQNRKEGRLRLTQGKKDKNIFKRKYAYLASSLIRVTSCLVFALSSVLSLCIQSSSSFLLFDVS